MDFRQNLFRNFYTGSDAPVTIQNIFVTLIKLFSCMNQMVKRNIWLAWQNFLLAV